MESSLARVPESATMALDEEMAYIKCNLALFEGGHPVVRDFSNRCPGFAHGLVRILDIGCGVANMSAEFAKVYPNASVVAVDASFNMLRHAELLISHLVLDDRISVRQALLPDDEFGEPDESFDLVFARSALHHFVDPAGFWKVVKRYAKPDAAVYVSDLLRPPSWPDLEEWVWQRFQGAKIAIKDAFLASLLASHTATEIEGQLVEAGLDKMVVESRAAAPMTWNTHVTVWCQGRFGKEIP